jgi:hypothetical protein
MMAMAMALVSRDDAAQSPGTDSAANLMTLPAEIRVDILKQLFTDIKLRYIVKRRTVQSGGQDADHETSFDEKSTITADQEPGHTHPFAVLRVTRKLKTEAQPIIAACPTALTIHGCADGTPCPWDKLKLPNSVRRRIWSLTTDEPFCELSPGTMNCCFFNMMYSSLQRVEICSSPPTVIPVPVSIVVSKVLEAGTGEEAEVGADLSSPHPLYKLDNETCLQVSASWPGWRFGLSHLVECGWLTLRVHCQLEGILSCNDNGKTNSQIPDVVVRGVS